MAAKAKKRTQKQGKRPSAVKAASRNNKPASNTNNRPPAKSKLKKAAPPKAKLPAKTTRSRAGNDGFAPVPVEHKPIVLSSANSGLTKKEIAEFRETLLQKRAQLMGDVTTMRNEALSKNRQDAAGDLSNMPLHMADVGSDNYEQEFTLGLIESERQILREIDGALERIKNNTFGVCAATGEPIGKARLRATPWAKFSYEYVLAQERGRGPRN